MRLAWLGWLAACVACGGGSFSSGSVEDGGSANRDAGDAASDAEPGEASADASVPLRCGPTAVCAAPTPVCCVNAQAPSFACAHDTCGCETQLPCRRKDDCPGPTQVCCIAKVSDSACSNEHYVASCKGVTQCLPPSSVLCDPAAPTPCGTLRCKTDDSSLMQVGLPANEGFGVCGT